MPERQLNRGEIAELVDRLRALLDIVDENKLSATTAITYRLQGAVCALDAVLGGDSSRLGAMSSLSTASRTDLRD